MRKLGKRLKKTDGKKKNGKLQKRSSSKKKKLVLKPKAIHAPVSVKGLASSMKAIILSRELSKEVELSSSTHLQIDRPKIVAPEKGEKDLALKTLQMIYENSSMSGNETQVFKSFLERFEFRTMDKEELYSFLSDNPSIRRKIWENITFGEE